MAFKHREEIVGKRFVCVTSAGEVSRIADWGWKSGVVRASSHKDTKHRDLTVLVEWDGSEWQRREWIRVYAEGKFAAFLVEHTLVWAARHEHAWPALNFRSLVDQANVNEARLRPLEFLLVRGLAFVDYSNLRHYHAGSEEAAGLRHANPRLWAAVQGWNEFQDGQRILLTTPSVLAGYRVAVYRAQGTTQWYTAVIGAYNTRTRALTLTDDTVLEEHSEDPGLVQMKLLGDGVVESILKGESVGMRRRTNAPPPNGPYATRARGHAGYCNKTRKTTTRTRSQYPVVKGLELHAKNNGEIKGRPKKHAKQPPHPSLNEVSYCEERSYSKYKSDGSEEERDLKDKQLLLSPASVVSPQRTSPAGGIATPLPAYDKTKLCNNPKDKSSQVITANVNEEEHAKMSHAENQSDKSAEEIYVYRDPHLVKSSTSKVRHVESLQHHAIPPRPYLPMMLPPPPPNYLELMWQQQNAGSAWPNVYSEEQLRVLQSHIDRRDERERHEREKLDKEERKRAQQEAVQQHFEESLRLANAKRQNMNRNALNTISRSAQVGMNSPLISVAPSNREIEMREKAKLMETKERLDAGMQRNEHEKWHFVNKELKSSSEIRASIDKFPKPGEPGFNLYGYQPFQHTFVSQAQSTASSPSNNTKRTLQRQERPSTPGCIKPSMDSIVGGNGAFKPYEYSVSPIPPAHQSSSSRCISEVREQPQNLVKSEPPTNTYNSLIQQGVLPNPLYTATTAGACITSGTPVCRSNSISTQIRPYSLYNVRPPLVSPSPAHLHILPDTPPPPLLTSQPSTISKSPVLSCNTPPLNLQNPINSIRKKPSPSELMCPKKRSKLAEEQLLPPNLQPQNSTSPSSVIKSETTCESPPSPFIIEVSSPPPTLTTFIEPGPQQDSMPIYYSKLEKSKNRLKTLQSDSTSPNVSDQADIKIKLEPNDQTTTSSSHTKLKKAWLQRHSENEDKKSEPSVNIECEPIISVIKEECLSPPCLSDSRSAELTNDDNESKEVKEDSTSSASEGEKDAKGHLKRKPKLTPKAWGYKKRKVVEKTNQENLDIYYSKSDENRRKYKDTNSKKRKARKGASNTNSNTIESPKKNGSLSMAILKRTGQTFLQDGPCYDVAPKLPKCRECRMTPHQRNKKMPNIFCRFYAYRKLKYGKNGTILNAGFSDPNDANDEDLCLWLPPPKENLPIELDIKTSKFILQHVGDYFCSLVLQEKQALCLAQDAVISWKRVVQGVREQCDVCDTTLFNIHWVCHKCGFVVCMDCLKARQNGDAKDENVTKDKDEYRWLLCSNRQPHEQDKLMITQIIAGPSLWHLGIMLHEIQLKWQLQSHCICNKLADKNSDKLHKKLLNVFNKCVESSEKELVNGSQNKSPLNGIKEDSQLSGYSSESGGSPLSWLADVAIFQENKNEDENSEKKEEIKSEEKEEGHSTLRDLLIRPSIKYGNKDIKSKKTGHKQKELEYIVENYSHFKYSPELPPPKSWSIEETSLRYPNTEHSWLCGGQVLLLQDPEIESNIPLFQEVWSCGHPVIVCNVRMQHPSLWTPDALALSCRDITTDLLNCQTGAIVSNVPLQRFWEGFENVTSRIKDEDGVPTQLRLKDWPPGDELSDLLPQAYKDLLDGLPLGQYTLRTGSFNMASHFPDLFARPDLGPRMCTAYGSIVPNATTGLQMDVCDSVNILIYVGYTKEDSNLDDIQEVLKLAGCDSIRNQKKERNPGALWHIFNSQDSNKIREFLIKLSKEKGEKIPSYQDPLYDQVWYLDEHLRKRLSSEYGVEAYSIAQYLGDAVFIPAGAPHQVHNLYSCIRISSDFVSAENTGYSLQLTQDSRHSTEHHFIHEDKLQIKNLMYHAVKDALALLQNSETENDT